MNCNSDKFLLYPYSEYAAHTKVININDLNYDIWLKIPEDVNRYYTLFDVDADIDKLVEPNTKSNILENIQKELGKPWLRINSTTLNKKPGQHIYKFSFINTENDDILFLYFSYILQHDNPDKPYIYMRRDGGTY
jgi:hypothetical protein